MSELFTVQEKTRSTSYDISPKVEAQWKSFEYDSALVSIVTTAFNLKSTNNLYDLIISLTKQPCVECAELLLVIEKDKSLFDKMIEILRQFPFLKSTILYCPVLNGMSDARNLGGVSSIGNYLAFVDDDVVLSNNWLSALISVMKEPRVIAATGPTYPIWSGSCLEWFPVELSWMIGSTEWLRLNETREIRNTWGSNMAVRKNEFLMVGGFSLAFGLHNALRKRWFDPPSEDVDLSFRLKVRFGGSILYVPDLKAGHKVSARKISWKFIVQRSYSVGYQRNAISRLYRTSRGNVTLDLENQLLPKILKLWPESIFNLRFNPKNAMNTISLLFLVSLFTTLGYFDRRRY